jgi:hypothetical protein
VSEMGAEGMVVTDSRVVRSIRVGWAVRDVDVMRTGRIFHLAAFIGGLLRWLFFWRAMLDITAIPGVISLYTAKTLVEVFALGLLPLTQDSIQSLHNGG